MLYVFRQIEALKENHEWIVQEKEYFGEPGGLYDFKERDPKAAGQKAAKLQERKEKLSRNVNARAHSLLGKEEEQVSGINCI